MTADAEKSAPFQALINLDDARLIAPDNMPALIRDMCREGGYPAPETRGAIIRCALESLAMKYRTTLRNLDKLLGRKTECLHIIGGGVQNRLLCRMTADACGIPVVTGPIEATALGNIGVQAMAVGALDGLSAMRAVITGPWNWIATSPKIRLPGTSWTNSSIRPAFGADTGIREHEQLRTCHKPAGR